MTFCRERRGTRRPELQSRVDKLSLCFEPCQSSKVALPKCLFLVFCNCGNLFGTGSLSLNNGNFEFSLGAMMPILKIEAVKLVKRMPFFREDCSL